MLLFWEPIIWINDVQLNYIETDYLQTLNKNLELLFLGYFIFLIGITGLLLHHLSVIYILMSIELIFLGSNIIFIAIGSIYYIIQMPVYILLILTLSAAETAIILSLIFLYYNITHTTTLDILEKLKF